MSQETDSLNRLLAPSIEALGFELVGVEYNSGGQHGGLLRVYVDKPGGVTVDDCQQVSYQVSGVLDVEDPIRGHYTLEVSSPGLDRPLFKPADFERFEGEQVKVRLSVPVEGRRNFSGLLKGMRDGRVVVQVDDQEMFFPVEDIDRARLVPEF